MERTNNQKAISIYIRNITKNYLYSKENLKNITYKEIIEKWEKQKETGKEIFKNIENLLNLKGDCDDFVTLLSHKALKENKEVKILLFVGQNNFAYHTAVIIVENGKNYLIDVWKIGKKTKLIHSENELYKYYVKAKKILIIDLKMKLREVNKWVF